MKPCKGGQWLGGPGTHCHVFPPVLSNRSGWEGHLRFFPFDGLCSIAHIHRIAKIFGWKAFLVIFKLSLDSNLPGVAPRFGSYWLRCASSAKP